MQIHYPSQTDSPDLFWLRDHKTGTWILGQQRKLKSGKFARTWNERLFLPAVPPEMTEEELLAIFKQAETDLIFYQASGDKTGRTNNCTLSKALEDFATEAAKLGVTWRKS